MTETYAFPLPVGAELGPDGTTKFRIWAPSVPSVALQIEDREPRPMLAEGNGHYALTVEAPAGTRYAYRLPDGLTVPDPVSRRTEGGVHGSSVVVDPRSYQWRNTGWKGRPWHEAVIYELHIGLCGGFNGVREKLPGLKALGVTIIELMPINEFPGKYNWGYDGTLPYSPDSSYGTPDELKAMIDEAHDLGLCVMLDVVYNHFGPDGAYVHVYAKEFFTEDFHSPWGAGIDFRRPEVRGYFIQNALYWLNEYRFDGLRFDAVHAIEPQSFLGEMGAAIHLGVEQDRCIHLVLEHEGNEARLLRAGPGEPGFDGQWTDDTHHCLHVLLTGETGTYYQDYEHATRLLARCLTEGFAYQGEISPTRGKPRGQPSAHLPPSAFVIHIQNHDQIGNRAHGERMTLLTSRDKLHAATALLLLSPLIPLMFMGDEWGTKAPFLFFTDHHEELADLVRKGRSKEFGGFGVSSDPSKKDAIPDPNAPETFEASRVTHDDTGTYALYRMLLALRREHVMPGIKGARTLGCDVIGPGAVNARWSLGNNNVLTIMLNLCEGAANAQLPDGEILHESRPGTADAVAGGTLPAASALVVLTRSFQ